MDIRECYEKMGASYDDVLQRMGSDALVERFTGSFLSDGSYQMIADGIEAKDAETAFRGAHTLKGVCLNLGFQKLYEVSAELTEALRDRELTVCSGTETVSDHSRSNQGVAAGTELKAGTAKRRINGYTVIRDKADKRTGRRTIGDF